jgi:hypothetical protein
VTRWDRKRSGRAGATVAALIIVAVGLVVYLSAGGNVPNQLRSYVAQAPSNATSTMLQFSNLAILLTNLTSHLLIPGFTIPLGVTNATSNWAGYIVRAAPGSSASSVSGSWTVPSVDCATTRNAGVMFWVGLGGINNAPLEQIGTMAYCRNGQPNYAAWYEALPSQQSLRLINGTAIAPGETISASVTFSSATNAFTYSMTVSGQTAASFTQTYSNVGAPVTAEWVVEAPVTGIGSMIMADFGSVSFTSTSAAMGSQTSNLVDYSKAPGGYLIRSSYVCSDNAQKAATGPASTSGFSVSWSAGGNC